jgi:hypothetical protein
MRIAFNAEAFGYGPAAAIYLIRRELGTTVSWATYLGAGHTLNFNTKNIYNEVVDTSSRSKDEILAIINSHDYFITACDFQMAKLGTLTNSKIVVYDMLSWHWDKIPRIVENIHLYIVQDFFNVKERIRSHSMKSGKALITEAIIPYIPPQLGPPSGTLFNIGGVSNPFLDDNLASDFVLTILDIVKNCTSELGGGLILNINPKLITNEISDQINVDPLESAKRLSKVKLSILSPGLGNIYESALYSHNVIWLPPLNNSQGQQLFLIKKHFPNTIHLDWSLFMPNLYINYFDKQHKVMAKINSCMKCFVLKGNIQNNFSTKLREGIRKSILLDYPPHKELTDLFGTNGLNQIFNYFSSFAL